MILSGKDLIRYRVNQIKRVVAGLAFGSAMVGIMTLLCIVYG